MELVQIKAFFIRIFTNRIFIGVVGNIIYFSGIGIYFTWDIEIDLTNYMWWIKLIIFGIIITIHRDICKLISKYGW